MTRFSEDAAYTAAREEVAANPGSWQKDNEIYSATIEVDSERTNGTQTLLARVAIGDLNKTPIVRAPAWSDSAEFDGFNRSVGTERDLTGHTVIGVDFPEMNNAIPDSESTAVLTEKQIEDLKKRFSMNEVSKVQWAVAQKVYKEATGRELTSVHLWGNSMGASGVISLAETAPEWVTVEGMGIVANVAWEPHASNKWLAAAKLGAGYLMGGMKDGMHYMGLHPDKFEKEHKTSGSLVKGIMAQPKGFLLPLLAMGQGRDGWRMGVIGKDDRFENTTFTIANAELDKMSPNGVNQKVAMALGRRSLWLPMREEYHGMSSDPVANAVLQREHLRTN